MLLNFMTYENNQQVYLRFPTLRLFLSKPWVQPVLLLYWLSSPRPGVRSDLKLICTIIEAVNCFFLKDTFASTTNLKFKKKQSWTTLIRRLHRHAGIN